MGGKYQPGQWETKSI